MKKFIPKNLKIFLKSLIWRWYLIGNNLKPFNPLYKKIIRGKHIDRFYIENFLQKNSDCVRGACLEIEGNEYTLRYGGQKVEKSDILDINTGNKRATIHGDLKNLRGLIADNTYDCVILTQTLQYIDDYQSAIKECHRIVKPRGVVLATLPAIARIGYTGVSGDYWRFTEAGVKYAFSQVFSYVDAQAFGNVRVAFKSLVGAFQEFSTEKEMGKNDPNFPTIVTVRAIK
ncbi:MAG: hypothetical protein UX89_C0001G0031 [Parcubacteria group bacterium GW2011_GWA2_47_16]|nr:MAG: hypothetical protein UX89_C0001G0031 [Parcubacteria group bacterium GW2011_GWA2_47_16]